MATTDTAHVGRRDTAARVLYWPADGHSDAADARTAYYWADAQALVVVPDGAPLALWFPEPSAVPDEEALLARLNGLAARALPPALVPASRARQQWVLRVEHPSRPSYGGGQELVLWVAHHAAHAAMAAVLLPFRAPPPPPAPLPPPGTLYVYQERYPVHVRAPVRVRGALTTTAPLQPPRGRDDAAALWDDGAAAPHCTFVSHTAGTRADAVWLVPAGASAGEGAAARVSSVMVFAATAGRWVASLAARDVRTVPRAPAELRALDHARALKERAKKRRDDERSAEARKRARNQPSLDSVWATKPRADGGSE